MSFESLFSAGPLNRIEFRYAVQRLNIFDASELESNCDNLFDQLSIDGVIETSQLQTAFQSFDQCSRPSESDDELENTRVDVGEVLRSDLANLKMKLDAEQDHEDQLMLELQIAKREQLHLHEQLLVSKTNYKILASESDRMIQSLTSALKEEKSKTIVQKFQLAHAKVKAATQSQTMQTSEEILRLRHEVIDFESAWKDEKTARQLLIQEIEEERRHHRLRTASSQSQRNAACATHRKQNRYTQTEANKTYSDLRENESTNSKANPTDPMDPTNSHIISVNDMYRALEHLRAQLVASKRKYHHLLATTNERMSVVTNKNNLLEHRMHRIQRLAEQLPILVQKAEISGECLNQRIEIERAVRHHDSLLDTPNPVNETLPNMHNSDRWLSLTNGNFYKKRNNTLVV